MAFSTRSVCESLSRLAIEDKTSTRSDTEISSYNCYFLLSYNSYGRFMDKLIAESFTAVEAVWDYINPLQAIGHDVVGDIDPVIVKRKYM